MLINICAACSSPFVKFAKFSIFLVDIPKSSPVISGISFFKVLNVSLSIFKFGTILLIASATFFVIPNLSAKTISLGLRFVTSGATSSAAISTLSVTSCINSSPNTLFDASIALAGRNLFI